MSLRNVAVHGHFYQPPRESPWLEAIELQDSAYPFHDWNERITAECYAPNASARILDEEGLIAKIVSNYERMSFNVGPTLLQWMEQEAPGTYDQILEADRRGRQRFDGHGPAIAQAYNHLIMPLANRRDKRTQIRWGIADFEHRFGRPPEGMWLPETAVDAETLDLMAAEGILFTILEPHQAEAVRPIGEEDWEDVSGGRIDPTRPYLVELEEGRTIAVFFYDGPASRGVAFEGLLDDGDRFADRLLGLFGEADRPQVAHIATDGETYGHHHRMGEMALAYALERIDDDPDVRLAIYGQLLAEHPPDTEVRIVDDTSWSCVHGVERWRSDCGCSSGMHPGWHQRWRKPLREVLDWLRDGLEDPFVDRASRLYEDPWAARDAYISVVLDRESAPRFLEAHAPGAVERGEEVAALQLMELQRHAMLMYTSCGWFFDELSGIETVQVLAYASRAMQLASQVLGLDLEADFVSRLEKAPSNLAALGDGRGVYERHVQPARVDLVDVVAHHALTSLFVERPDRDRIYCFDLDRHEHTEASAGTSRLAIGRLTATSRITGESMEAAYGALHLGDHNLTGGVRRTKGTASYRAMVEQVREAFERADLPETLRRLDRFFGAHPYSMASLFRDDQRRIVAEIVAGAIDQAAEAMGGVYRVHAPLLRFLVSIGVPIPEELRSAARVFLDHELASLLRQAELDPEQAIHRFEEARFLDLPLDAEGLAYHLARAVERAMGAFERQPEQIERLERVAALVGLASSSPVDVEMIEVQDRFYRMRETVYPEMLERTSAASRRWVARFRELGAELGVAVG